MSQFKKSNRKNKKYQVITPKGKTIHFGNLNPPANEHFKDSTPLKLYSHLDHGDKERKRRYLARVKGIKDKNGNLTANNKESANYYSIRFLWN